MKNCICPCRLLSDLSPLPRAPVRCHYLPLSASYPFPLAHRPVPTVPCSCPCSLPFAIYPLSPPLCPLPVAWFPRYTGPTTSHLSVPTAMCLRHPVSVPTPSPKPPALCPLPSALWPLPIAIYPPASCRSFPPSLLCLLALPPAPVPTLCRLPFPIHPMFSVRVRFPLSLPPAPGLGNLPFAPRPMFSADGPLPPASAPSHSPYALYPLRCALCTLHSAPPSGPCPLYPARCPLPPLPDPCPLILPPVSFPLPPASCFCPLFYALCHLPFTLSLLHSAPCFCPLDVTYCSRYYVHLFFQALILILWSAST